ncbi:Coiled-coil domain-containing protein 68 [Microtus ochrogaster]|uniref:Coiled-coil domain-containing protein 68 n=1 Tax=Microtus ochrogaster TaxID=79684 RepID=A0A8J6GKD9_MICOH|nr:Coiled-coil domain-containing protein 68 [Microtus ochrogaster]
MPGSRMTTVTVTTEVPPRRKTDDDSVSCGSSSAHILEETEYVRKQSGNFQNGSESTTDPTSLDLLMENMRRKDQQLLEMNRENEVLKIKLEASREAGAAALRNVAQRLFDNYQTHSEDMKKRHEDSKRLLQINNLEKEQMLNQRVENLSQLSEKLEEKHCQIIGLENRVQRMENEKKTLLERKSCLESKLLQLKSKDAHSKSCQDLEAEISILQEQICHLQFVIHSQHQNLRNIIQEVQPGIVDTPVSGDIIRPVLPLLDTCALAIDSSQ